MGTIGYLHHRAPVTEKAADVLAAFFLLKPACPISGRDWHLPQHDHRQTDGSCPDTLAVWTRLAIVAIRVGKSEFPEGNPISTGGLAVQRRYRVEGRDATARATWCRVIKQNARKWAREETKLRDSIGLPAPARVKYLPLD